MEEKEFVLLTTTVQPYEAELIQGLLADHQIECTIINKRDSEFFFGDVELHVAATDLEAAQTILRQRDSE
ncbi:MAG: DUF2007 domain-containing protein [Sphingobacteriia bacterium]|nr:DUF2007 domain-containing protein [Sphingobacteriia bacterium]